MHSYKDPEDLILQCSYIVNPKGVGTYTFYNMHCFLGQCTHTIKNSEKRIAERMNDRIGLLWDEFLTIDGSL